MKAKEYLKKMTNIPNQFIDDLFSFYDENTLQTDFVIDMNVVAKWLEARKDTLMETLKRSYKQNIDYTITKKINPNKKQPHSNNHKQVLLTPDCFKRLCMLTRSSKGETVRSYFIEIENTFIKYRQQTIEGIKMDMKRTKYQPNTGYVYVILLRDNLHKVGYTKDMNKRMSTYRTGRGRDMEVLYLYQTEHLKEVEGCLKSWLRGSRYQHNTEIYEVELDIVKKLINECGNIGSKLHLKNKVKDDDELNGGKYFVVLKTELVSSTS